MSITYKTFKYEWKSLVAAKVPLIITFILLILLTYAFYQSHEHLQGIQNNIDEAIQQEQAFYGQLKSDLEAIENGEMEAPAWFNDPRDPYRAGFIRGAGVHIYKAPAYFSTLAIGQSDIYPHAIKIPTDESVQDLENPYNMALGFFDPAFVLTFLLPLFIIGLSYNIISSEREQGTLRLLLSQPVGLLKVFIPKISLRLIFILVVIWVFLIVNQLLFGSGSLTAGSAFGYLFLSTALYIIFWFALALIVNLLGYSSSNNLVILFSFWLISTVIIPTITNLLATNIHMVPSRVEYVNAIRAAGQEASEKKEEILAAFYGDERELMRNDIAEDVRRKTTLENLAVNDYAAERVAETRAVFERQLEAQQELADKYTFSSPSLIFYRSLTALSETDRWHYKKLQQVAEQFSKDWKDHFRIPYSQGVSFNSSDYEAIPYYRPNEYLMKGTYPISYPISMLLYVFASILLIFALRKKHVLV
jgi:ABC-2 type transport system permease protein